MEFTIPIGIPITGEANQKYTAQQQSNNPQRTTEEAQADKQSSRVFALIRRLNIKIGYIQATQKATYLYKI